MLEVQRFLRSCSTNSLQRLSTDYDIRVDIYKELGIAALNYRIDPDFSQEICKECRALFLEVGTWEVASRSFPKFFGIQESWAAPILKEFNWDNYTIQNKLDGTLICMYFYNGAWRVATRHSPEAHAHHKRIVDKITKDVKDFYSKLDPDIFYSFELISPDFRIIIPYTQDKLVLLACWNRETLEERRDTKEIAKNIGIETSSVIENTSYEELIEHCKTSKDENLEGFVLVDDHCRRLKVKSLTYVNKNRLLNSLVSNRTKLECILNGSLDTIASLVSSDVLQNILCMQDKLKTLIKDTVEYYESIKHIQTQKEFAKAALNCRWSHALFGLRNGSTIDQVLNKTLTTTLLKLLEYEEDT